MNIKSGLIEIILKEVIIIKGLKINMNLNYNQKIDLINNRKKENPILVTGAHRSGTTWVGKMLNAGQEVTYIYEPFNVGMIGPRWITKKFPFWFYYIPLDQNNEFIKEFQNVVKLQYPLLNNISRIHNLRHFGRMGKDCLLSIIGRIARKRALIKDPIAIFSAEWLAKKFNMQVIVMIRRPEAFASSLKRLNWQFDFSNWLKQDLLIQNYLYPFKNQIIDFSNNKKDIIDQSILLWNCIYYVVNQYRKVHPDWCFIRQEDLALHPITGFKELYKKCDLNWSNSAESIISSYSNSKNIKKVPSDEAGIIRRDSKATISAWKYRLNKNEIYKIQDKTREICTLFYDEDE